MTLRWRRANDHPRPLGRIRQHHYHSHKLMTVCYSISSGEYSDYGVCAIFTTKEKAEAELFKYGSEAFIEEFPLDPVTPEWPTGFKLFSCFGNLSGPVNAFITNCSSIGYESSYFQAHRVSPNRYRVYVIAKNEEHAVKIAAEKFAKADAIQAGIAL